GAYSETTLGFQDAMVVVLDMAGTGADDLVYSTYFGGDGFDDSFGGIDVANGIIYLVGDTSSSDFPTTSNASDPFPSDNDLYFCILDPAGNGTDVLTWSTVFGSGGLDDARGIAVDSSGAYPLVYVIGDTQSSDEFPAFTFGGDAFDHTFNGQADGFIAM